MEIKNKQDYYLVMAQIENFLQKGFAHLTQSEDEELSELSMAAEAWEMKMYPMPMQPTINDILTYIMFQNKINQTELSIVLNISKASLSEILSGKKKPNLEVAKQLHTQFNIDGNLLLQSF